MLFFRQYLLVHATFRISTHSPWGCPKSNTGAEYFLKFDFLDNPYHGTNSQWVTEIIRFRAESCRLAIDALQECYQVVSIQCRERTLDSASIESVQCKGVLKGLTQSIGKKTMSHHLIGRKGGRRRRCSMHCSIACHGIARERCCGWAMRKDHYQGRRRAVKDTSSPTRTP